MDRWVGRSISSRVCRYDISSTKSHTSYLCTSSTLAKDPSRCFWLGIPSVGAHRQGDGCRGACNKHGAQVCGGGL